MSVKKIPLHPLFFGIYSVLSLLSYNIGEISIKSAARSFFFALLLSIVILLIGRLLLKDWQRAGLLSSVLLIPIFSYGHIYNYLSQLDWIGRVLGRHRVLIPIFVVVIGISIFWIIKRVSDLDTITSVLNLVSFVLIILPIFQIVSFVIRTQNEAKLTLGEDDISLGKQLSLLTSEKPDIYFIIADSYTRQDVLLDDHDYDNMPFIEELRELGFYVAECGQSNYSLTAFSLASTLNLNYVDTFGDEDLFYLDHQGRPNQVKFGNLIRQNKTRKFLEGIGYTTIAFETGFNWLDWTDADLFLHPLADTPLPLHESILSEPLNEFESLLLSTSIGLILNDFNIKLGLDSLADVEGDHVFPTLNFGIGARQKYDRAIFTLDTLEEIVELDGPKFVFVHLFPPHWPYVFAPDGQFSREALRESWGYPREVAYLNSRFASIFETMLENSERPAIIILQGDHGSAESVGETARIKILNAIYMPGEIEETLYPEITSVNTFRLLLDQYFGLNLGLVDDISYNHIPYKPEAGIYIDFEVNPNICK